MTLGIVPIAAGAAAYVWPAITAMVTAGVTYGFYYSTKNDIVELGSQLIENSQTSATQGQPSQNDDTEEKLDKASSYIVYGGAALVLLIAYKYAKKLLKF